MTVFWKQIESGMRSGNPAIAFPHSFFYNKDQGVKKGFINCNWRTAQMIFLLFRIPKLRISKMLWVLFMCRNTTALDAPSVAQFGLSSASLPSNCWKLAEH